MNDTEGYWLPGFPDRRVAWRISLLPALRGRQPQAPVPGHPFQQYVPPLDRDWVVRRPRVGHTQGCCAPWARRHRAMTRWTIIALLLTLHVACGAVPRLFQESEFTAASFAEAVNHFVALGEDAAVQELRRLAADSKTDNKHENRVKVRIGWMCRVLFEPKTESLREPRFGALSLPYKTMPNKSWPLNPVALSGSTYLVLSDGYILGGRAENTKAYIDYCRKSGVFRKKPVSVPTKAQALRDAAALRQSAAWQSIKWKDSGENWSYTMDEGRTWEFIQEQAESIR